LGLGAASDDQDGENEELKMKLEKKSYQQLILGYRRSLDEINIEF